MKKSILTIFAVALGGYCMAQGVKPPKAAEEDFKLRAPVGTIANWEKSGNNYETDWSIAGYEIAVIYDANGKFVMMESEIAPSELPKEITAAVEKSMAGAVIKEAERQDKADKSVGYQVEVKHQGKVKEVTFDDKGNQVGQERQGSGGSGSETDGSDGSEQD